MKTPLKVVFACAIGLLFLSLYGATHPDLFLVLDPAGPIALYERSIIFATLLISALVVVVIFAMLISFAILYREDHPRAHHHYFPDWDHHTRLAEALWWIIPSIMIFALSVLAWVSTYALDPYRPLANGAPLIIQVVALDWKWLFIYPEENIASVNLVEFPAGKPVRFEITADAPMNTFWIPQLGGQIMAMPGMTTQLNLMADRIGDLSGLSGNISGKGFAGMHFIARSVTAREFDSWVRSVQQSHSALTEASYAALAKPSENVPVALYSPVAPDLYTGIIMRYLTPRGESPTPTTPKQL